MFMCKHCLEQFDDKELAYTLIPEIRLGRPEADMYLLKFCSKKHVQDFLENIKYHQQKFVLSKKGKGSDKAFEPAFPLDLLLLVGSSKAS